MFRNNSLIVAVLIFIFSIFNVHALESDATKEITIQSNSADFDRKSGIARYIGDVVLEQGTLKITADQITLFSNADKKLTKAVAIGKPAHFQQLMEGDKGLTKARAETITYLTINKQVTLLKGAILEQEGNVFTGETIVYDILDESVSAKGGTQTEVTPDGEKKPTRIKMIIQPESSQPESSQPESDQTEASQPKASQPETESADNADSSSDNQQPQPSKVSPSEDA